MTDEERQKKIEEVERERKRREAELVLLLAFLSDDARKMARAAIRLGVSPLVAINQVVLGAAHVDQPGAKQPLVMSMLDAYSAGLKRAYRWAAEPFKAGLGLGPAVTQYFEQKADFVVQSLANQINSKVSQVLVNTAGSGVSATNKAISEAFAEGGFTKDSDSYLVLAAEQAIVSSYNEGLLAGYISPAVKNDLRGFIHVSILDDRTTKICEDRADFSRFWNDPYWLTNWPPLHFRCRSVVLPIFRWNWTGEFGSYPTVPVMEGFGSAPPFLSGLWAA